jgi:hypothetical protein
MGKNYANRKPKNERPESDYYPTPRSLVWKLIDASPDLFLRELPIVDPACGEMAILKALKDKGFTLTHGDDLTLGRDFLKESYNGQFSQAIMNPPFSLFDEFILKAKSEFPLFASILKTNFFGAVGRHKAGVWANLKYLYIFNRQVDYRTPLREDGHFHLGNLITGFGVWDRSWDKDYWETRIIDINDYAKLGGIKEDKLTDD